MLKRAGWILALIIGLAAPAASFAQTIYVAAMRGQAGTANVMSGLYSINLSNGAATFIAPLRTARVNVLGRAGPPDAFGGLAVDGAGTLYVTPSGAYGTLDTVDPVTGALAPGPQLKGAPFPGAITAMTFTPSGLLLAINSNV